VLGYVWVQRPEIAVERVAARVQSGGHGVPEADIRRRWVRSVYNFWNLYLPLADRLYVYDNSTGGGAIRVAYAERNKAPQVFDPVRWELLSQACHDQRKS
jgi:predicted ABC-type ATPase